MNEQLIVKNFGPIKDATVDFKRVTVFIGPTGGGKSTLAKLAAMFHSFHLIGNKESGTNLLKFYNLQKFHLPQSDLQWTGPAYSLKMKDGVPLPDEKLMLKISSLVKEKYAQLAHETAISPLKELEVFQASIKALMPGALARYIASERAFVSAIEYSWAGLIRDDIGLSKYVVNFANDFSLSRKSIIELDIPFLNAKYLHQNGQDFIKIPNVDTLFRLYETASGIQSVTPLLVLLEHLSRNTEQAQSFIIEEPELNLYPTAQQGLLNWLVEKCTKGENDLTITTHSPYILSSCNLLLEAYKVAQLRPDLEEEIAAIVPKACWLNPDEFAAYYVAGGTVKPITDDRTHLIGGNELDAVSGDISDSFRKLLRLKKQAA